LTPKISRSTSVPIVTAVNDVREPDTAGKGTPAPTPTQPAVWTLASFARRELEGAVSSTVSSVPDVPTVSQRISTPLTADPVSTPYTGQPSLVEQVLVAGLQLAHVVLGFFGAGNPPQVEIPFFNDGPPPFFATLGLNVQRTEFDGMPVYTLQQPGSTSDKVIVALHGGAYVGQINLFHWITYADMARDTGATVVVPIYPLAPDGTASVVVPETADLLSQLIDEHGAENVSVVGNSAGGGLALAAVQELVRRGAATPGRMVLLDPWLDVTVSDPASNTISDPILNAADLRNDGVLWAGDLSPTDPLVSPLNGSLAGLPPTYVYSGSMDLLSPQTLRLRDLASAQGLTNFTFILRNGEIHDWPIFPFLPEAITDLPTIESQLLGTDTTQQATAV
jgi:acetyl esterase/lipase